MPPGCCESPTLPMSSTRTTARAALGLHEGAGLRSWARIGFKRGHHGLVQRALGGTGPACLTRDIDLRDAASMYCASQRRNGDRQGRLDPGRQPHASGRQRCGCDITSGPADSIASTTGVSEKAWQPLPGGPPDPLPGHQSSPADRIATDVLLLVSSVVTQFAVGSRRPEPSRARRRNLHVEYQANEMPSATPRDHR